MFRSTQRGSTSSLTGIGRTREKLKCSTSHLSSLQASDQSYEQETEVADLDSYLTGIQKAGRKTKKKIDWSKAFEDDSFTVSGDVAKSKPTNQRTSLKSAAHSVTENMTNAMKQPSVATPKVSSDISSISLSEMDPLRYVLSEESFEESDSPVRQKANYVEFDSNDDSEVSPLRANVYSIDELLEVPCEEGGASDTSDHGSEVSDRFALLHTVDELQPIEYESEGEVSVAKQPDGRGFGILMPIDQREFIDDSSVVSMVLEASLNGSCDEDTEETTQMSKAEQTSSDVNQVDDENEVGEKDVDYSESFDSESQDMPSSLHKQTEFLVASANTSNADPDLDKTARSNSEDNLQTDEEDEYQQDQMSSIGGHHGERHESEKERNSNTLSSSATSVDQSSPLPPNLRVAGVAVQTDPDNGPEVSSSFSMQGIVGQLSIDPVVLNTLCGYSPATLALHEMIKEQLKVTQSFVTSCQHLADERRENFHPGYQYTTLEDTQWYIKQHRPRVRTMAEAMNEVNQTD